MKAIVILGHGSRAEEAIQSFYQLVDLVKEKIKSDNITAAFLGSAEPKLEAVVSELAEKGITQIIVVPLFLFRGIHVTEDIPRIIDQLQQKYGVEITCTRNLGSDTRIADIVVDRIREVG